MMIYHLYEKILCQLENVLVPLMCFKESDEVEEMKRENLVFSNYTAAPFAIDRYGKNEILLFEQYVNHRPIPLTDKNSNNIFM